jgi:hypothetical protein
VDGFISLKEVLDWMDAGQPFSIRYITADDKRDSGGKIMSFENVYKSGWLTPSQRGTGGAIDSGKPRKSPHHYENSTRNLLLPGGEIRKVHIRLIRKFNNLTVL